jgi:ADP-ribose pyrophosphatase YjhB (NUDIX family)
MSEPAWLPLLRGIAAQAENGLFFAKDPFDLERYAEIAKLARAAIADRTGSAPETIATLLEDEKGYITPKLDVRGGVFQGDRILLVREAADGLWALPGGYAEINLSPAEAIEAEIEQESGFIAKATRLVALLDRRRHHPVHPTLHHCFKLYFLCDIVGGSARGSVETLDVDFFAEDALPPLSPGRTNAPAIRRLFKHWRQPELAPEFD